jgi:hypothetical protein
MDRAHAALLQLARLWFYVTLMRLFGFRIRRPATPRTPRSTPAPTPTPTPCVPPAPPAAPPIQRRKHKYLDRESLLAALEGINAAVAAVRPDPVPAPPQPQPESQPRAKRPAPRNRAQRPPARPSSQPTRSHPAAPARRFFQNPLQPATQMHAHFITISKRTTAAG